MFYRRPSENRINARKARGEVLTLPQIQHIMSLIAEFKLPDATYSEEELAFYEMMASFLDNPKRFTNR